MMSVRPLNSAALISRPVNVPKAPDWLRLDRKINHKEWWWFVFDFFPATSVLNQLLFFWQENRIRSRTKRPPDCTQESCRSANQEITWFALQASHRFVPGSNSAFES